MEGVKLPEGGAIIVTKVGEGPVEEDGVMVVVKGVVKGVV